MKTGLRLIAVATCLSLLGGCAATIPVKVAAKTTKLGAKTAKAGIKTTAKIGAAIIPDGDQKPEED